MRRTPVGLADLADALRRLAPAEPADALALAAALGLHPLEARRTEPRAEPRDTWSPTPPTLPRVEPNAPAVTPPPAAEPVVPQAVVVTNTHPPQATAQWPPAVGAATPLAVELADLPSLDCLPPLVDPRAARALARDLAAQNRPGNTLDVDALVDQLAQCRLPEPLPRRTRRSVRGGVQLLIQFGRAMQPFHHDVEPVRRLLQRVLGPSLQEVLFFSGCPSRGVQQGLGLRDYPVPRPGTTVLLLTDLGLGRDTDAPRVSSGEWLRFVRRLGELQCPVHALVPYAPHRWPDALARRLRLYPWEARSGGPAPDVAERWHELARALSLATCLDPVLVRRARRELLPGAGPEAEADLLLSDDVGASNPRVSQFRPEALLRLRAELAADPAALDRAREFLVAHRAAHPLGTLADLEEELVYQVLRPAAAGEGDVRRTLTALLRTLLEPDAPHGLARWVLSALPELPEWVRALPDAGYLHAAAALRLGATPAPVTEDAPAWLLPPPVQVGVAWADDRLVLREPPEADDAVIEVPGTLPRLVQASAAGDREGRSVTFTPGKPAEVWVPLPLELRTLAGAVYEVNPREAAAPPATLPAGVRRLRVLHPPEQHERRSARGRLGRIAFSPDGRRLAAPSRSGDLLVWNVDSGHLEAVVGVDHRPIYSVAWSPTDALLVVGGSGGRVVLLHAGPTPVIGPDLLGDVALIASVAWSPDGRSLASAADGGSICTWDVASRRLTSRFLAHDGWASCVAWSPDGQRLATSGQDSLVKLWRAHSEEQLETLAGHGRPVFGVAWHPDGTRLASAGVGGKVMIWDSETGRQVARLDGHAQRVLGLAYSADGQLLVTRAKDIRLWDAGTGEELACLPLGPSRHWAAGLSLHWPTAQVAAVISSGTADKPALDRRVGIWRFDREVLQREPAPETVSWAVAKVLLIDEYGQSPASPPRHGSHEAREPGWPDCRSWVGWLPDLGVRRDGLDCQAVLCALYGAQEQPLFADHARDASLVMLFCDRASPHALRSLSHWLSRVQEVRRAKVLAAPDPPILVIDRSESSGSLTARDLAAFCRQHELAPPYTIEAPMGMVDYTGLLGLIRAHVDPETACVHEAPPEVRRAWDEALSLVDAGPVRAVLSADNLRTHLGLPEHTAGEALRAAAEKLNKAGLAALLDEGDDWWLILDPSWTDEAARLLWRHALEAEPSDEMLLATIGPQLALNLSRERQAALLPEPSEATAVTHAAVLDLMANRLAYWETEPSDEPPRFVAPWPRRRPSQPSQQAERSPEPGPVLDCDAMVPFAIPRVDLLLGRTGFLERSGPANDVGSYSTADSQTVGLAVVSGGEADSMLLHLSYGSSTAAETRRIVEGLVEAALAEQGIAPRRFLPVRCAECQTWIPATTVRERWTDGADQAFCGTCGAAAPLAGADSPLVLSPEERDTVAWHYRYALRRTELEQVLFRLRRHVLQSGGRAPRCWVGRHGDDPLSTPWVRSQLLPDLRRAGIEASTDATASLRPHRADPPVPVIPRSDAVVLVGSPANLLSSWVRAGTAAALNSGRPVYQVLRAGDQWPAPEFVSESRMLLDVRDDTRYLTAVLELTLLLHGMSPASSPGQRWRAHLSRAIEATAEVGPPTPRPRRWVLVGGPGPDALSPPFVEASTQVAASLAWAGLGLVTSGGPSVDRIVARAFAEVVEQRGWPLRDWLQQVAPVGRQPSFPGGQAVQSATETTASAAAVERADAVLLIGGRGETRGLSKLLQAAGKPVIAVGGARPGQLDALGDAPTRGRNWRWSRQGNFGDRPERPLRPDELPAEVGAAAVRWVLHVLGEGTPREPPL